MDILWPQMLAMAGLGLGLLATAVLRFHKPSIDMAFQGIGVQHGAAASTPSEPPNHDRQHCSVRED